MVTEVSLLQWGLQSLTAPARAGTTGLGMGKNWEIFCQRLGLHSTSQDFLLCFFVWGGFVLLQGAGQPLTPRSALAQHAP